MASLTIWAREMLGQEELPVVVVILPSKGLTLLMPVVLLQGSAVTPLCRLRVQERSRLRVQERKLWLSEA